MLELSGSISRSVAPFASGTSLRSVQLTPPSVDSQMPKRE
jgi:hypothetical protein